VVVLPVVLDPGTYILNGTVDGCPVAPDTMEVNFIDFFPSLMASDTTPCVGDQVSLTADGGGNTYQWFNVTTNQNVGTNNSTFTFTANTTVTYRVTIQSPEGCMEVQELTLTVNPLPNITIQDPGPACVGDDVLLVAEGAGIDGEYDWTGALTGDSDTLLFQPTAPGSFTFTVTGRDTNGCTASATVTIPVSTAPTAQITATTEAFCDVGGPVTLLASGGVAFEWEDGSTSPIRNITVEGDTTIILIAEGVNGCTDADTLFIPVLPILPAPNVSCGPATSTSVTFVWDSIPGAEFYDIEVDNNPVGTTTDTFFTVSGVAVGGNGTIRVQAFSGSICPGGIGILTCMAAPCPVPEIELDSIGPFCLDGSASPVLLSATVTNPIPGETLIWSGPGVSQVGMDFFFDPVAAGGATHQLTLTYDDQICVSTFTLPVVVADPPIAAFNISANPVCSGDTVIFTYAGGMLTAGSITFDFGGGQRISGDSIGPYEVIFPSPGAFTVSMIVQDGACIDSTSQVVDVIGSLSAVQPQCFFSDLNTVTVNWPSLLNANSYEVLLEDGTIVGVADTFFTLSGLIPDSLVTFQVRGLTGGPCS
ncbi:MAG: hypothetical protein AAGA62_10445, partial [Bacteroidota bacterium]